MIPATYRASFSYLLRHPWQLALSLLGIVIGVAVIVAVDLANSSARKAFLMSMDAITGEATHQVIGGPDGVREAVYRDLRTQHGITNVAPIVEGSVNFDGVSLQLLGIDLFAEQSMRSFTGETTASDSGNDSSLFVSFLVEPGAATTSQQTARDLGLTLGDTFELSVDGMPQTGKLVATFSADNSLDRVLVTDIATAQEWLGRSGRLSRIDVRIADEDTAALQRLESVLPDGTQVLSAAGRTRSTADMSQAFMTNLTAMSLLALLVGLFLIFNAVNFSVLQRRGLVGVLRALGLTRRQLLTMILAEAAVVGLVAAIAGVLLGAALGEQLLELVSRTINDLYFRVNVTDVSVSAFSVVKGLVAGVGAALLAAAVPALEATSYQPRLALTRSVLERRARFVLLLCACRCSSGWPRCLRLRWPPGSAAQRRAWPWPASPLDYRAPASPSSRSPWPCPRRSAYPSWSTASGAR
jgi:putative ABC transport system permease protein